MDFSFVVPIDMVSLLDIVLTLIFVKTIKTGYDLMKFLNSLIPLTVPNRLGIIKLYNSLMPINYRANSLLTSTTACTHRNCDRHLHIRHGHSKAGAGHSRAYQRRHG
jgi:hypothetical protein